MNMGEEQQLRYESDRGRRAQELLDDDLLKEAFNTLKEQLKNQWADSPVRDTEGREKLWLMLKLLESVEGHLSTVVTTGKMASIQLTEAKNLMDRLKESSKAMRDIWV
jgi:hypothetical protein